MQKFFTENDLSSSSSQPTVVIDSLSELVTVNGTGYTLKGKKQSDGKVSVQIAFKLMKKKLKTLEYLRLEKRISKLWKLVEDAEKSGQIALSEEFFNKITKEVKESELYAFGYRLFLEEEMVDNFIRKASKVIYKTKLKNYARLIPKKPKKDIQKAISKKVFDEIYILHTDATDKKLTEEEKKDPIAFGKFEQSNRYYFITDWEDEFCDLTLDDIVDNLDLKDEDITLSKNPSL